MSFRLLPCVAVLVLFLAGSSAYAQANEFAFEAVTSHTPDGAPQVTVRVEIPYSSLRFVRRTEGFASEHTIQVVFHYADENQQPVRQASSRSFPRTVTVASFDESRSPLSIAHIEESVSLPPASYIVSIRVEDLNGGRPLVQEQFVEIPAFSGAISVSDVTFLDAQTREPRVLSVIPSDISEMLIRYELYSTSNRAALVRFGIRTSPTERRARGLFGLFGRRVSEDAGPITLLGFEEHQLSGGVDMRMTTLSIPEIEPGDYDLIVQVEESRGTVIDERVRTFSVQHYGLPTPFLDLDSAIAQLRYVARDREIRAMQEAPTYQERLRLFTEFWDRRDPTPGTPRNERMEEYYSRISHANASFGAGSLLGWSSDQGEVYIRFGEPDTVENHGVDNVSRPYEVWYYERMGRRFIFVQNNRSGVFQLMVPLWDERTRM